MSQGFYTWSKTAATNASADASINWSEGQAPSSINDSARAQMARTAEYRDDVAGAIVTAGSSTAYTVASFQVFDTIAHLSGQIIAFTPHVTNGAGPVTLNVDSTGAKALRTSPNTELLAGMLIQGTPYTALLNNSDGAFYLDGFYGNPFNVPISAGMDYWGPTAPNSSFAFPIGQAISRTTYASLFGGNPWSIGTTYGAGDGSTTFNLPDKTGRVSFMKEASATRMTSTYFGGNSTTLGAVGGGESDTLLTANLPPYTPAGSVASSGSVAIKVSTYQIVGGAGPLIKDTAGSSGTTNTDVMTVTSVFTGSAQGGTSTPIRTVQPSISCNYIIRVL